MYGKAVQGMKAENAVNVASSSATRPPRAILHPPQLGRSSMAIRLDHLIVPSHDPLAAAKSLAGLLGVPWEESRGGFTPVYVNETLTLDFADRGQFESHHVCHHSQSDGAASARAEPRRRPCGRR